MTKVRKKVDFTGQPVYVRIDVHKKNWTVCICTESVSYRPFGQAAEGPLLLEYLLITMVFYYRREHYRIYFVGYDFILFSVSIISSSKLNSNF